MKAGLRFEQLAELESAYPTYVAIVGLTARELGRQFGLAMGAENWPAHKLRLTAKSLF